MPFKDLTGKKFGRLTATRYLGNLNGKGFWECICSCENETVCQKQSQLLINGKSSSCGCIKSPPQEEYKKILKEKLLQNSYRDGECLIWKGPYRDNYPHGIICCVYKGKKGNYQAHRISYHIFNGEITDGLFVLHSCDRPQCIEPSHLHLGTQKDNMKEMRDRNRANDERRGRKGEAHHKCKLSEEDVLEIRSLKKEAKTNIEIAKIFNVSDVTISYICLRRTWNHV